MSASALRSLWFKPKPGSAGVGTERDGEAGGGGGGGGDGGGSTQSGSGFQRQRQQDDGWASLQPEGSSRSPAAFATSRQQQQDGSDSDYASATAPRQSRSPFAASDGQDVFTSPGEHLSPNAPWSSIPSATLSSPIARTSPEMRAFYGQAGDSSKMAEAAYGGTGGDPVSSPTLFSHSRHFGTDFTTARHEQSANDDDENSAAAYYSRDPSTLPRRNHTIGSGVAAYRRRLDRHFEPGTSSTGVISPSKNSLSAITGGADDGDDDWEAMMKRKESLIPNDEEEHEVLNSPAWRPIGFPGSAGAFSSLHRRFPSQPISTFGTSPVEAHSPVSVRSSGHQRSESVGVNRLDQGPFASSPVVQGSGFGSGSGAQVRRHQSLNYHAGRHAASRMTSVRNATGAGGADQRRPSPNAGLFQTQMATLDEQDNGPRGLNAFTYPARPVHPIGQEHADATGAIHQLSLQSLNLTDDGSPDPHAIKPSLPSLVTDRDALLRGATDKQAGPGEEYGERYHGPASASAYVRPIGYAHHRRHSSSSSTSPFPIGDDGTRTSGMAANSARDGNGGGVRNVTTSLRGIQTAHPASSRQRVDQIRWDRRADTPPSQANLPSVPGPRDYTHAVAIQHGLGGMHGNAPAFQMPTYYVDPTFHANNAPLLDMRGNVVHAPAQAPLHWPMPTLAMNGVPPPSTAFFAQPMHANGVPAHLPAPMNAQPAPPQQQQSGSLNDPALREMIAAKGYNPPTSQFNVNPANARFFVIKSFTEDDVQRSLKHEIWASTEKGNQRLDRAFKESSSSGPLYLLFSVNASGHFCGVAEMLTPLDYTSDSTVWVQEGKWKGTFRLRWIYVKDVPNSRLRHIRLTNTADCKPITQSRDTQELPPDGGRLALKIIAEFPSRSTLLQNWAFSAQAAQSGDGQTADGVALQQR